ncbi:MAG: hypothetical protein RIR12_1038 [Bacteroidota bacterium]|jgi:hypothetical protein
MKPHVHTVRLSVLFLCFVFYSKTSFSQAITFANGKYELGLGIGPIHFLGDLGGGVGRGTKFIKDLDIPLTKLNKGLYLNYYPTEWLGLRLAGNIGYVEGDDTQAPAKGGAEEDRKYRNLSFHSKISEVYAGVELYPTVFFEKYDGLLGKIRPFVVGGVGVYHFDPYTKGANGKDVRLQPLSLEGQGFPQYPDSKPYKLTQMNILLGVGFKYYIKENFYVGLEMLHRKLFTDYIDDVSKDFYVDPIHFDANLSSTQAVLARSLYYRGTYTSAASNPGDSRYSPQVAQRGDPSENDAFFSSILRMGWRLGGDGISKQLKCPVFY